MSSIDLSALDLVIAALLILLDAGISVALRLGIHQRLLISAGRMVIQLVAVGYLLRFIFKAGHPALTGLIALVMMAVTAREILARPQRRFRGREGYWVSATGVAAATLLTVVLALTTAIRPHPWYDPRYAIPLIGIALGSVLNAGSLTLSSIVDGLAKDKAAIEAQLALGIPFRDATRELLRDALRRGMLPIVNQMAAAGIITLPGIMTGQIIAGMDPIAAVKYQILLMFLLAGASGMTALLIGHLSLAKLTDERDRLRLDRLADRR